MFYVIVYIYIINYIDMRRINENDMSRIIKKVLREESNEENNGGVEACFKAAGIPVHEFCKNFMNLGPLDKLVCIQAMTATIGLSNAVKIGTLIACLGAKASMVVKKTYDREVKRGEDNKKILDKQEMERKIYRSWLVKKPKTP